MYITGHDHPVQGFHPKSRRNQRQPVAVVVTGIAVVLVDGVVITGVITLVVVRYSRS